MSNIDKVTVDGVEISVGDNKITGSATVNADGVVTGLNRVFVEIIAGKDGNNNDVENLVLTQKSAYSNYIAINSDWSGTGTVYDVDRYRNMGFDAASDLNSAISYVRGHNNPYETTGEGGRNKGDALISIAADGKYTASGYLMTAADDYTTTDIVEGNGVTNLVLEGREGVVAEINNTLRGSDGSVATSLTINNLKLTGNVYGGGIVTINNGADVRASGTAIAGGLGLEVAGDLSMANDSSLVINGGTYVNSILAGGSFTDNADAKITVSGETKIEINNTGSEVLTISRNIYGGSYAAKGEITQSGDAYVVIDSSNEVVLRGNIYAAGGNGSGTLNMTGDTFVTFTGDAANLTFTGTVYGDDTNDTVIFKDFAGTFNGSLREVESLTISGKTQLELGRRQTTTANTELTFSVTSATGKALYTVRDMNRWEFSKNINITIDGAKTGTHVLVDNYAAGYDGFTYTLADNAYTLGSTVEINGVKYAAYEDGDRLLLDVVNTQTISNTTVDTITTSGSKNEVILDSVVVNENVTIGSQLTLITEGDVTLVKDLETRNGKDSLQIGANTTFAVGANSTGRSLFTGEGADEMLVAQGATLSAAGTIHMGGGNDTFSMAEGSKVEIAGDLSMTDGNDTVIVGKNAELTVKTIFGGNGTDSFSMGKGSVVNAKEVSAENIEMDVDSILNYSGNAWNVHANVTGISDLTTDIAGAKVMMGTPAGTIESARATQQLDGVDAVLGTATQIAGTATAETTDDVWASLSRIDGDLVVAWGRSEAEVGAALEAFDYAKNNMSLAIGEAVVSTDLADGFDTTDTLEKKSNGTLA